jgi:hypothetical protein
VRAAIATEQELWGAEFDSLQRIVNPAATDCRRPFLGHWETRNRGAIARLQQICLNK